MFSWTHSMWVLGACLEFFRSGSQNFFLKVQKLLKNINFLNVFWKMITWTIRLMFWKRCPNCSAKVRNSSAQGAKITKKSTFFRKKNPQNFHLDSPKAVLSPLGEVFVPKTKKLSKYGRDWKTMIFPKIIFLNLFPQTRKLRFRKPYSKFLAKRHEFPPPPEDQNSTLKAQKLQKNHQFQQSFSSETSAGHVEQNSEKHNAFFCQKIRKSFAQSTTNFASRHERH